MEGGYGCSLWLTMFNYLLYNATAEFGSTDF